MEVIAKSLVENPDEVVVTETEKEDAIVVELKVGPADMGKVIGRQGQNCQGNPHCSESGIFKKQQKSDCRYSAMKIETGAVVFPWLLIWVLHLNFRIEQKESADGGFIKSWSYHHHARCTG